MLSVTPTPWNARVFAFASCGLPHTAADICVHMTRPGVARPCLQSHNTQHSEVRTGTPSQCTGSQTNSSQPLNTQLPFLGTQFGFPQAKAAPSRPKQLGTFQWTLRSGCDNGRMPLNSCQCDNVAFPSGDPLPLFSGFPPPKGKQGKASVSAAQAGTGTHLDREGQC